MAERINWEKVDPSDPRFFELDPTNPNTNISASTFDPTDPTSKGNPVGEKYNEWLRTANIGDKFDWGQESGNPTQKGLVSEFTGFNKMGTPIIKTNVSKERADWRGAIEGAGPGFGSQLKALMDTGRSETEARFLLSQYFDPEYVARNTKGNAPTREPLGVLADGTPFYGWDSAGKPVTSPTGSVYSVKSSSDAISQANLGASPLTFGTGNTPTGTTPTGTGLTSAQAKSLSAFEVFRGFLRQYGIEALAADVEKYKLDGLSDDEMLIRLRTESPAYKRRFSANEARVAKGLTALSEAAYIGLEDQYQDVMRRYGLPETYYTRGEMGRQEGFEKFIAGDVSPVELEDRIQTAYNRVINANPEVGIALRNFYPNITNGDIVAYALNPDRALSEIQRKITAAEIGGAAVQAGLTTNEADADYLASYGVTKEQAQQGYRTISGYLPRAQQLSSIYGKQVEGGPYTQASAEREVFNVPGAAEEERKRQRITALEQAAFSGQSGLTGGALGRERAGQF